MSNEAQKAMTTAQKEALFQSVRDSMKEEARVADILAKQRRIHYDACIRKGFTAEQALVLCVQTKFA